MLPFGSKEEISIFPTLPQLYTFVEGMAKHSTVKLDGGHSRICPTWIRH